MHWATAYSTSLTSMMTSPKYDQKIKSFEDILRNRFGFGMTATTTRLFEKIDGKFEDEISKKINRDYILCKSAPECLKRVATNR